MLLRSGSCASSYSVRELQKLKVRVRVRVEPEAAALGPLHFKFAPSRSELAGRTASFKRLAVLACGVRGRTSGWSGCVRTWRVATSNFKFEPHGWMRPPFPASSGLLRSRAFRRHRRGRPTDPRTGTGRRPFLEQTPNSHRRTSPARADSDSEGAQAGNL
jgi:hypothetical protein